MNPLNFTLSSKESLTSDSLGSVPENLRDTVVEQIKARVSERDFPAIQNLTFQDLANGVATELDPESEFFSYLLISHPEPEHELHVIVALGGNPMGFVLSDSGEEVYSIVDRQLESRTKDGIFSDAKTRAAVDALIYNGAVGVEVSALETDLREHNTAAYMTLFYEGDADGPAVMICDLTTLPSFLSDSVSGPMYFYMLLNTDEIDTFLADEVDEMQWDHEMYNVVSKTAQALLTIGAKSGKLFEVLAPGVAESATLPWKIGFSERDFTPKFAERGFQIVPANVFLDELCFVKFAGSSGSTFESEVEPTRAERMVFRKVMTDVFAFSATDPVHEKIKVSDEDLSASLARTQMKVGDIVTLELS